MVVIRLARCGAKNSPKYRITVADSRFWLKGRYIEVLGHYNPDPGGDKAELKVDLAKANDWISKGAQPSSRVKSLLKKAQANQ